MPNGESRNWIRFQITLESFYTLYGKWPTVIHLSPSFINELERKLSAEDFKKLQSKINLKQDEENSFLCLDEKGNSFDYAREPKPEISPEAKAINWLRIIPPKYYE